MQKELRVVQDKDYSKDLQFLLGDHKLPKLDKIMVLQFKRMIRKLIN